MIRTWFKQGAELLEEIQESILPSGALALWYIGQCGFVLKYNSTIIYIDPVLTDLTGDDGITRKYYQAPFLPEQAAADYILCTHGHDDHMNIPTLTAIASANSGTRFMIPGGCRKALEEAGIPSDRIICLGHDKIWENDVFSIRSISAAHPVYEYDEAGRDLALSYHLTFQDTTLLHVGDTYLTDQLLADYQKLPSVDLFLPPINGGDYFRTSRNCIGNLSARESATLAQILHADMTIPMHFDMMMGNTVDPLEFVNELWTLNSSAKFHIPALGERFIYFK